MTSSGQQVTPPKPPSVPSEAVTHALAAEMATNLFSLDDLATKFEISKSQIKRLSRDPIFRRKFAEAKAIWEGSNNVQERIRQKSALLLEDSILPLYSIIHDKLLAPAARIDAFQKLMAIADMNPTKGGDGGVKESFTLNIHMPSGDKVFTIDGDALEVDGDEDEP